MSNAAAPAEPGATPGGAGGEGEVTVPADPSAADAAAASTSSAPGGVEEAAARAGAAAGTRSAIKTGVPRVEVPAGKKKGPKKATCTAAEADFWASLQVGQEVAAAAGRALVDDSLTAEDLLGAAEAAAQAKDDATVLALALDEVAASRREEARAELAAVKGGLLAMEKALREKGDAPAPDAAAAAPGRATATASGSTTPQQQRLLAMAYGGGGSTGDGGAAGGSATDAGKAGGRPAPWALPPPTSSGGLPLAAAAAPSAAAPVGAAAAAPGGWSSPSWLADNTSPYDPDRSHVGPAFYLSLPRPWNAVPREGIIKANEVVKLTNGTLPKFGGEPAAYGPWRSSFIPCVHLTTIDITYKVLLLRSCLEPTSARMRELINSIICTGDGYKYAITELERRYGGLEAMLMSRQEALLALPEIKEGDFRLIEILHTRLGTFLVEWAGFAGGEIDETESLAFYTMLMSKLEGAFSRRFLDWLRVKGQRQGLQSLKLWLGQQLDDHRTVERFQRRRANSLRLALKESEGPLGGRRASTSQVPRKGGAFFAGGEELEQEETQEEGTEELVLFGAAGGRPRAPRPPCSLCKGDHPLGRCEKFKSLSPTERKTLLTKESRCYLCFQTTHPVTKCRLKFACALCGRRHHTLIHGAEVAAEGAALLVQEEEEEDTEGAGELLEYGLLVKGGGRRGAVSLRTIPLWVRNPDNGKQVQINALLDDGCSHASMASKELAQELDLVGPTGWATTEGVGGKKTTYRTFFARIEVQGPSGAPFQALPTQVMERPAGSYSPVDWTGHQVRFPHLADLPLAAPVPNGRVDLLIGSKYPRLTAALEERCGGLMDPVARATALGWTVTGSTRPDMPPDQMAALQVLLQHAVESAPLVAFAGGDKQGELMAVQKGKVKALEGEPSDRQLARLVQRMLEVEDPGEAVMLSPREEFIVKQVRASLKKSEGRYVAGCTWKPGEERPAFNLPQAKGRLESLERSKYFKDPATAAAYGAAVRRWEEGGEVKEVGLEDHEQVRYLIPHFPVCNPNNHTTPLRIVMDCKVGLNNHLLSGPNILNDVVAVLLRFRSGLVSFSGDIKKMFLRIFLAPEDRPYHCFLWREAPDKPLRVLQFQVHVFGNAGSPFVAVFVVKEHAKKYVGEFPVAVESINNSTLIDDVLDSADSVAEARNTLMQIRRILAEAGMEMAKHFSSDKGVLEGLPQSAKAGGKLGVSELCQKEGLPANLKALGIQYDAEKDEFSFTMETPVRRSWTKRGVLRLFPRLYDPLGLLLPYTIGARIYFSSVATPNHGWDTILPADDRWQKWLAGLEELSELTFPRCVKRGKEKVAELHVFVDESALAYAAAAFLVAVLEDGTRSSRLALAKVHVAPRKELSIPRLELLAAELGVKVAKQTLTHLKVRVDKVKYWSDSLTVLYWLNDDAQRFQAFVHNKLQKIRRSSDVQDWHWVPTNQNPADLATRGISPARLKLSDIWREGPPFLQEGDPPAQPTRLSKTPEVILEMKKAEQVCLLAVATPQVVDFSRFSRYEVLRRVVWRILEWRDRVRRKKGRPNLGCSWKRAELALVKQAQIPLREALLSPSPKSRLKALGMTVLPPKLAEDGVVRGQGRLRLAKQLPREFREPALLPPKSPLGLLLLGHAHQVQQKHAGGKNAALNRFLAKFWMPRARAAAFQQVKDCVPCRRRLQRPQTPQQAPLPGLRLPGPTGPVAFAVTALDCAGPYKVKRGRSYEMHYFVLFTCCHTRAVRLEPLTDLSTETFLMALTRAAAKGVLPHTVLSDNGGNFDGANRLLRALWLALEKGRVEEKRPEIKWKFNPPYASHFGGVFERLVGAAKAALYHALPSHLSLTQEQFATALAEAEGILNARPLAYVAVGEDENLPLTPNHFLHGSASTPVTSADWEEVSTPLPRRWRELQRALKVFQERFMREILPFMQATNGVRGAGREIQEGDIVTFFLPSAAGRWPMGRVIKTFPGQDGRTRVVEIEAAIRGDSAQPMATSSDRAGGRQPMSARSAGGGRGEGREKKKYRRAVASVALLLPAEATTIHSI